MITLARALFPPNGAHREPQKAQAGPVRLRSQARAGTAGRPMGQPPAPSERPPEAGCGRAMSQAWHRTGHRGSPGTEVSWVLPFGFFRTIYPRFALLNAYVLNNPPAAFSAAKPLVFVVHAQADSQHIVHQLITDAPCGQQQEKKLVDWSGLGGLT